MWGLGYLMPYGNAVYNTETGRYEIPGQAGSFGTTAEVTAALYAGEILALEEQEPQPTSVMIGPYAGYPVGMIRTLPNGVRIPEETYQLALAQGTLPQVIQSYMGYQVGSQPGAGQPSPAQPSAPASTTIAAYSPRVSLGNLTRPGQNFQSGDEWLIQIGGARPNAPVSVTAKRNGNVSTSEAGRTDAGGFFQLRGRMSDAEIGSWEETWRIAPEEAPRLTFTVTSQPAAAQPPAQQRQQPAAEPPKQEQREATPSWVDQIKAIPWWIWAATAGGMAVMSVLPRRA